MKIFHKKFLNQEQIIDRQVDDSMKDRAKSVYFLNQVLIWGIILIVLFFVFKFIRINFF